MAALKRVLPFILGILLFGVPEILAAEDDYWTGTLFKPPSNNPTLTGAFTESMDAVHTGMVQTALPDLFFIDVSFIEQIENDFSQFKGLFGGMIPVSENLAIPLFAEFMWNNSGDLTDYTVDADDRFSRSRNGTLLGGGLVFYGRYGLLAGYAAYSWEKESHKYWWSNVDKDDSEWSDDRFQWAVFPVINAEEYPVLNTAVRLIDGFFSLDNLKMNRGEFKPTYKANILFKDIPLSTTRYGFIEIASALSISAFAKKDWYNFDAKYNLYAGNVDIRFTLFENLTIAGSFTAGYRDFFDIQQSTQRFENGMYVKAGFQLLGDAFEMDWGLHFYWESGTRPYFEDARFSVAAALVWDTDFWVLPLKALFGGGSGAFKADMYSNLKIRDRDDYYDD